MSTYPLGNSRNPPTQFETHRCPFYLQGCPYSTWQKAHVSRHLEACGFAPSEDKNMYPCRKGCQKGFSGKAHRANHEWKAHTHSPRACSKGCQDGRIFQTRKELPTHERNNEHTGFKPNPCPVSGCEKKPLNRLEGARKHVRKEHGNLSEAEREKLIQAVFF